MPYILKDNFLKGNFSIKSFPLCEKSFQKLFSRQSWFVDYIEKN